jgi:hypothetical protein
VKLAAVVIILRKDQVFDTGNAILHRGFGGFTRFPVDKVQAAYRSDKPVDGYGVALVLRPSQADTDFGVPTLFLSADDVDAIKTAFDQSDKLTHDLLGRGWNGRRPYFQIQDFM